MRQQNDESVADFAHRFTETQNELEQLLPNIHRTPASDGHTDIELITAFTIKLKDHIAKELISRDVKHTSLQAVISAAERFEMHLPSLASTQSAAGREIYPIGSQLLIILELYLVGLLGHSPRALEDLLEITMFLN